MKESQAQENRTRHAKTSDGQVSRPKSAKTARPALQVDHSQLGSRGSRQRNSLRAKNNSPQTQDGVPRRSSASTRRTSTARSNSANIRDNAVETRRRRNLSRSQNTALNIANTAANKTQNARGLQNSAARRKAVAKSPTLLNKLGDKIIAILALGYKYRRILGLIVVFVLFAATTFFVVRYLRSTVDAVNSAAAQPSPTAEFEPVACTADDVQLNLSHASRYAGQSVNFTIHYAYSGDGTPCYLLADKENLQVTVTSGEVEVWNSQQCGVGSDTLQLLFMPEVTHKQSYTWDGNITSASCAVTGPSKPGTYRAKVTGVAGVTDEVTFVLEQVPAAPATSTTDGEN